MAFRNVVFQRGLPLHHAFAAANLYWEAFSDKLGPLLRPDPKALAFLNRAICPANAICALSAAGQLLGVAGFKTADSAFIGGNFTDLRRIYGNVGALWRSPLLTLLERPSEKGVLLMDGICVAKEARGQGLGTQLLAAIIQHASSLSMHSVRLDVIETNVRAKALYEKMGFLRVSQQNLGPLRWVFGFRSAIQYRISV